MDPEEADGMQKDRIQRYKLRRMGTALGGQNCGDLCGLDTSSEARFCESEVDGR